LGGWLGQAHSQGVGNKIALQIYRNMNEIAMKCTKIYTRKTLEIRYPSEICLLKACGRIWAAFPLVAGKFLQKPASKSLLEMLKNTTNVKKIFCFNTENFHTKICKKNMIYDLSKSVSMLK
jgi:hypothetical protein